VFTAYVVLALAPDYLMRVLSGRVASALLDVMVGAWEALAVVAVTWVLVVAQRREEPR
jgi:hypothetical protein